MSSIDRSGVAAGLLLAAALLAGCADTAPGAFDPTLAQARTPIDQYAPIVNHAPATLALSVHASGVSPNQRAALAKYAAEWRDNGGAEFMTVQAPMNSRNAAESRAAAAAVASLLGALGVPPARLRLADYDAAGAPAAPVIVRYELYVAQGVDCASRWDNLLSTNSNAPSAHFGCTGAANLAVQIADAHDLVTPAATAPADSVRRANVLEKYRQGQLTSSPKDPQAVGAVSSAIN